MTWLEKFTMICSAEGDGAQAGGSGAAAAAGAAGGAGATPPAAAAGAGAAKAWHDGVAPDVLGFWQNKGLFNPASPPEPRTVAEGLTKFYREVERHVGAPPEELIRVPKSNAAPADISAYWQRIGVPAEAKDYDLSTVKFTDGKELDPAFAEVVRNALHAGRVPKDRAAEVAMPLVKHAEANDAAELAERTRITKEQQDLLDKNWGVNKAYNLAVAERALVELGKVSGLTEEQARQGWDALSKVGGIGASYAMEMLRNFAARTGEAAFVPAQPGQAGNNQGMSQAQALAQIESLKKDRGFYKQLMEKNVEATNRWSDLHKIAFPSPKAA